MNKLLFFFTRHFPMRIINDGARPYLERYYLGTLFGWQFYIHRFIGSDPDRGVHDYPWRKAYSIVLFGYYWEERLSDNYWKLRFSERAMHGPSGYIGFRKVRWFNSLDGYTFHRVVLPHDHAMNKIKEKLARPCFVIYPEECIAANDVRPCWTLFFHTKDKVKPWGFLRAGRYEVYDYSREGSQDNWWLTAPSRAQMERK